MGIVENYAVIFYFIKNIKNKSVLIVGVGGIGSVAS
jgi:hypothetical protein